MEVLDILNGKKKLERIALPCTAKQSSIPRCLPTPKDSAQVDYLNTETEKDYIHPYIKEEENVLLKSSNLIIKSGNDRPFDEISDVTMAGMQEYQYEKIADLDKTYNFAHKPNVASNLTISTMKDKIIAMIETNPVVVIQGPTGCGKTTQVPQYILDSCFKNKVHCNIIVSEPRRIAAMSIAKRVCEEREWPLGTLVGFQVGMIKNTSEDTRLTYCTTGVLLHKLINAKNMLEYTHVILDEVHERDQDLDFLLLVVRKLLRANSRSVKLVLMSATIDVEKFAKYFSSPVAGKLIPAPIIHIEKRNYYSVNIFYTCQMSQLGHLPDVNIDEPKITSQMLEFCRRLIIVLDSIDLQSPDLLHTSTKEFATKRSAILIFLPGIHEIEEMYALLSEPKHKVSKWDIVVLHSTITNNEQNQIFIQPPQNYRRIILSTNIAESSITVPDVKYVIDFCLTKQLVTDPKTNFPCLELSWASKAICDQRAGRTGRVMDGRVYRLVPKYFYDTKLPAESVPEMTRAPLENLVLKAKILDMGEPKALLALALDPPNLSNLEQTVLILKQAGALLNRRDEMQHYDGELTDLGRIMAQLPLDIHVTKLIMLGHVYSVLGDAIIIAASMFSKNMFSCPFGQKMAAYSAKFTWAHESDSDCIAFMNVYKAWMNEKASGRIKNDINERKWAQKRFVQIRVLREIEALVQEITYRLKRMGVEEVLDINKVVWSDSEKPFILKVVIAGAFYPNYFVRTLRVTGDKEFEGMKLLGGRDPLRTVYLQGWPLDQPGMLYARKIQNIFKDVSTAAEKIKVSFDTSSRVCVEFYKANSLKNEDSEVSRKILPSVYKAIKMRQSKTLIEIPLLSKEEAIRRAEELKLLDKKPFTFVGKDNISANNSDCGSIKVQLPPLDISVLPLNITHVIDPGHFWARVNDADTLSKLRKVQRSLNGQAVSLERFDELPKLGSIIVAPYNSQGEVEYCRAVIASYDLKVHENFAEVFYIDFGFKARVRVCDLRQLNAELATIPALALECVLANIKPSVTHNANGKWLTAAQDMFCKIIQEDWEIYGEIYSVVNSVVALKLVCVRKSGEQFYLNDVLIEKAFATFKEEDFLSRSNHEFRAKHMEMTVEQRKYYEELQYDHDYSVDNYPDPPEMNKHSSTVQLRGPFSPLEIELSYLTLAGRGKRVIIDVNSVNSVLLDSEMETDSERLLVAGFVSKSPTRDILRVRNTTFMPNIPGLTALLSLIFCPLMELRRNKNGTCYVGALCGLGFDPQTKTSLFPEHDMEVHFDVDISIEDIQEINKLRHWMSIGMQINMQGAEKTNLQEIAACQNKIKMALFRLMEKTRTKQDYELITNFTKWDRYEESLVLKPGRSSMVRNNVYNLHNALELEERNVQLEEMTEHLAQLKILATDETNKSNDIHCKFCSVDIFSIIGLRSHLFSQKHKQNEEKYGICRTS